MDDDELRAALADHRRAHRTSTRTDP